MFYFTAKEYTYLEKLLRHVYMIRTAGGEEDDTLSDLIAAFADGDSIAIGD
jgi:hypothetical protein